MAGPDFAFVESRLRRDFRRSSTCPQPEIASQGIALQILPSVLPFCPVCFDAFRVGDRGLSDVLSVLSSRR
eukprot:3131018-Rhodomonas_salina.3